MRRKILLIILILWTITIFYNSLQTASDSIKESSVIVDVVKTITISIYDGEVPLNISSYLEEDFQTDLRQFAHFFEFFIFYILGYMNLKYYPMCGLKLLLNGLYLSLMIATIDETIQLFVSGRTFQVSDLITDMLGSLLAFIIIYIISKFIKKDYGACMT